MAAPLAMEGAVAAAAAAAAAAANPAELRIVESVAVAAEEQGPRTKRTVNPTLVKSGQLTDKFQRPRQPGGVRELLGRCRNGPLAPGLLAARSGSSQIRISSIRELPDRFRSESGSSLIAVAYGL